LVASLRAETAGYSVTRPPFTPPVTCFLLRDGFCSEQELEAEVDLAASLGRPSLGASIKKGASMRASRRAPAEPKAAAAEAAPAATSHTGHKSQPATATSHASQAAEATPAATSHKSQVTTSHGAKRRAMRRRLRRPLQLQQVTSHKSRQATATSHASQAAEATPAARPARRARGDFIESSAHEV